MLLMALNVCWTAAMIKREPGQCGRRSQGASGFLSVFELGWEHRKQAETLEKKRGAEPPGGRRWREKGCLVTPVKRHFLLHVCALMLWSRSPDLMEHGGKRCMMGVFSRPVPSPPVEAPARPSGPQVSSSSGWTS